MRIGLIENGELMFAELKEGHDYRDIKKLINLGEGDCLDCVERKVGGVYFDFWLDDEGLLKGGEHELSCLFRYAKTAEPIVGDVMIAHNDGQGEVSGLSDEDCELLRKNFIKFPKELAEMKATYMDYGVIKFHESGKALVGEVV